MVIVFRSVVACVFISLLSTVLGCGSSKTVSSPPPPANSNSAPTIVTQPADASAQVGQTASFTVVAQGTVPLQYQWYRNGATVSAATSSSYTTPNLNSADVGDTFGVVVANSSGQVSSRSALLSIGPRTPLPGDLRFQQVGAPTSAPGYGGIHNGTLIYPSSTAQANGWGTPLSLGPGCIGEPSQGPSACRWIWFTFGRANLTGISISYTNQSASDLDFFINTLSDSEVRPSVVKLLDGTALAEPQRSSA